MKRRDLIKRFERNGWWLCRHGSNHDIYSMTLGKQTPASFLLAGCLAVFFTSKPNKLSLAITKPPSEQEKVSNFLLQSTGSSPMPSARNKNVAEILGFQLFSGIFIAVCICQYALNRTTPTHEMWE